MLDGPFAAAGGGAVGGVEVSLVRRCAGALAFLVMGVTGDVRTPLILEFASELGEIARVRAAIDDWCAQVATTDELRGRLRLAVTEACTNCVLHADCGGTETSRFLINVRVEDHDRVVLVRDCGVGARDLQARAHGGLGLRIIDCEADALYVSSKPGRGTSVGMRFALTP